MAKPVKKTAPRASRATASTTTARTTSKPRASAAKPRAAAKPRGAQGFDLNHDVIATRAYDLFASSGYPHGRDVEFWLEAERQLKVTRKA